MKRREFITLPLGAAALSILRPIASHAQKPAPVKRIGILAMASAESQPQAKGIEAFLTGLRDLGYEEGRNILIEYRFAEGRYDQLPALAAELVGLKVDVIVTHALGVYAAKEATKTIPIIAAITGDPIATGVVSSLARPGGNISGLTFFNVELVAKRLELLKGIVHPMSRVAVLMMAGSPLNTAMLQAMSATAEASNLRLQPFEVRGPETFDDTLASMADQQLGGLVIHDDPLFINNAQALADFALRSRLPAGGSSPFARAGGLMSYGVNFTEMWRRAAVFVDRVLKGIKPGDIPIERSTKFEVIVNLRTAKEVGITIPTSLLLRADEVIE